MRVGWLTSPILHVLFVASALIVWPKEPRDLGEALVVPVEIVTNSDETNIRAASPEVATLSPAFEDKGETLSAENSPPPEPIPAVEPLPTPKRERPQREDRLNLDDLDALLNRANVERGSRSRDAAPNAERSNTPRQAVGAGTKLTATQTARIASLLQEQVERCYRSPADRAEGETLTVQVQFSMTASGGLEGSPRISGGGSGDRAFDDNALRAVRLCAPYELPDDLRALYPAWREITLNFRPPAG